LHEKYSNAFRNLGTKKDFSRKDAKAQRKAFRNAVVLCAFAGEIFSGEVLFVQSQFDRLIITTFVYSQDDLDSVT
jgi:hypothetical protein